MDTYEEILSDSSCEGLERMLLLLADPELGDDEFAALVRKLIESERYRNFGLGLCIGTLAFLATIVDEADGRFGIEPWRQAYLSRAVTVLNTTRITTVSATSSQGILLRRTLEVVANNASLDSEIRSTAREILRE